MAIGNKIPSPKEISTSPVSFSPKELKQLRDLRLEIDQLAIQLGQLSISEIKLNEQENMLKNEIKKIEKEEQELAQTLTNKYGRGSLDIETGTFTPSE